MARGDAERLTGVPTLERGNEWITMHLNPFLYGNPVHPNQLIGRRALLRRVVGRIVNQGQSTALVGEPRLGKTSLLHYLEAPDKRSELYGPATDQLDFCYIDSQTLPSGCTLAQFWDFALRTLKATKVDPAPESPLAQHYRHSAATNHNVFALETLFQQLHRENHQLVLLLDEFDLLVHHLLLSNAEFFGSLRSLASRSRGAFTLVIASRLSLAQLNAETQRYNPTGSPFFNIFAEVTLGALAVAEVEQLLRLAGDRFTPADRGYVQALAGGHPYLLQAAAATMWDAYEEGYSDTTKRHRYVWEELRRNQYHQFADTWRTWQPPVRHAFTAIALLTTKEQALPQLPIRLQRFQERLPELMPELNALTLAGVLRQIEEPIGWQIEQGVLLTWLWDELIRELRDESGLGQWLRNAELDGRWDSTQRRQVQELIKDLLRTQPNAAINIVLTEGGAYIAGAVNVGGDFIGRDQI